MKEKVRPNKTQYCEKLRPIIVHENQLSITNIHTVLSAHIKAHDPTAGVMTVMRENICPTLVKTD